MVFCCDVAAFRHHCGRVDRRRVTGKAVSELRSQPGTGGLDTTPGGGLDGAPGSRCALVKRAANWRTEEGYYVGYDQMCLA